MVSIEEIVQGYLTKIEGVTRPSYIYVIKNEIKESKKINPRNKAYLFNEANFRLHYLNNGGRSK